jgi:hypothetical protein
MCQVAGAFDLTGFSEPGDERVSNWNGESRCPEKRLAAEQIVTKLRQIEALQA